MDKPCTKRMMKKQKQAYEIGLIVDQFKNSNGKEMLDMTMMLMLMMMVLAQY